MTRYEAYIQKDWREHGLAPVVVVRIRSADSADYGLFLVDTWCLGVKEAWGESDIPPAAINEMLDSHILAELRESIHPSCAKKLIEGAVAYAEALGFAPHRDFRKAKRVLSGIDAALCPVEFAFGREGRPCFVQGPHDSEERVERVLAMLDVRVGLGNYDYQLVDEGDDEDGDAVVRETLMDFLAAEPGEVPRFYHLSGLMTARLLCAEPIDLDQILDALWPEGRDWKRAEQEEDFRAILQDYQGYLQVRARATLAPEAPDEETIVDVWESDLPEQDEKEGYDPLPFMAALIEWAGGFWRATELWPEAWGNALDRTDLAPHWEMVRWWAEFIEHQEEIDAATKSSPPRNLGSAVKALARALYREQSADSGGAP